MSNYKYIEHMYCRKCGKRIPDDSNYCQHCGSKVLVLSPQQLEMGQAVEKDSWALVDFAHEFGKMQILKAANSKGELTRYALFTKETRVDFDENLLDSDRTFITEHKNSLRVKKSQKGFVLIEGD